MNPAAEPAPARPFRPPRLSPTVTVSEDGARLVYGCPYAAAAHWSDWSTQDARSRQAALDRYRVHVERRHPEGERRVDETRCMLCRGALNPRRSYESTALVGRYCSPECRAIAESRPRFHRR